MQLFQSIKVQIINNRHILTMYLTMTLAYVIMFVYFAFATGNRSHSLFIWSILDGLALFAPILILPRGKRWIMTAIFWIISAYIFANCIYAQFFSTIIKIKDYWLASTIDSLVLNSVAANLRFSDFIFLICPIVVTIISHLSPIRHATTPITRKHILLFISSVILLIGLRQIPYISRYYHSGGNYVSNIYNLRFNEELDEGQWMGLAFYIPWSITTTIIKGDGSIELTESQRQQIDDFLAYSTSNAITENRGKNLIFIVVESLNSWQVDYERNGFKLMPNLCKLMQADGVIKCLNVYSQAGLGGSSDGQFIYNSGLLPLRDDIVSATFATTKYPSLANALNGYHCVEVIGERPGVWNHSKTSIAYGYERLYSKIDIADAGIDEMALGYDEAIFSFADGLSTQLPQPFFMFITSLSMHYPFDLINCEIPEAIASDDSLSDESKKYIANTHYFDRCLGDFINSLKRNGLYDNSVIVLAADHDYDVMYKNQISVSSKIPFIALNTGITQCVNDSIGQVDVFPTVIDLMGVNPKFRGIGTSIFQPGAKGAVGFSNEIRGNIPPSTEARLKEAWDISSLIIRGNYFGPHSK